MSEPLARQFIDEQLRDVGWNLKDPNNVHLEARETTSGICDYILKDKFGRPLAVLEAKKENYPLLSADDQAKEYAEGWKVDFLFLANGKEIYFWDYKFQAYPKKISSFFSQEDLELKSASRKMIRDLKSVEIDKKIVNRKYQLNCINEICNSISDGKTNFLIEMATGTGKTRVSIAMVKKLFQANKISRMLFVSDRDELRRQTTEKFLEFLPEYPCYAYKGGSFKTEKKITVATYHSLINNYNSLTSGYYDLIIIDECHRSIYGKFRHILDHFHCIKIGLTATPYVFDSEIDVSNEDTIIVKDTLKFFDLNEPSFKYRLKEAIKDGYLVPYSIYKAKTVKTANEDGISVNKDEIDFESLNAKDKDELLKLYGDNKELVFDYSQLERKITIPNRNKAIVEEFRNVILYGDSNYKSKIKPVEGKTIVFAVTQKHAIKLAQLLDDAFSEKKDLPTTRYADFVVSSASDIEISRKKIRDFKKKKFPKILVSVGMLDTGFDCEEVVNIVFARHVKSNVLYQQMRGRGTRPCKPINKERFWIFDFSGVTDFHKDKEESENQGSLVVIKENKKKKTITNLIEIPVDDWIDPSTREEINYDEDGNIKQSSEKELKSNEIKLKFEGWYNGLQDYDYNRKKVLQIISQYLQANSDIIEKFDKKDFTYPPFNGIDKITKIFGNEQNVEEIIQDINKNIFRNDS